MSLDGFTNRWSPVSSTITAQFLASGHPPMIFDFFTFTVISIELQVSVSFAPSPSNRVPQKPQNCFAPDDIH